MRRGSLMLLAVGWCLLGVGRGQGRALFGARVGGGALTRLAGANTKAVVLFFVATDCPVSNREFPEMVRLREKFAGRGVQFWFVYPNATERVEEIRGHQAEFDPDARGGGRAGGRAGEVLVDPEGSLVRLGGVGVTPEAAILVPSAGGWRAVYRGRIDDRFVHLGVERPRPTEMLVERGLTELLAGQAVTADKGVPVGCAILPHGVAGR